MPSVPTISNLLSPPTNVFGLYQYLAQRIPGYDPSEYLRELNAAYIHVWEEITKIQDYYFTNIVQVKVASAANPQMFDLQYNVDGNLTAPVSPRLYQIARVRVLAPSGGLWQPSHFFGLNDPEFYNIEANPTASSTQTGPYYFVFLGHGRLRSAIPLGQNTTLEVTYIYWPILLTWQYSPQNGTVSSSGSAVTGAGTTFTQLLQPDFQADLPAANIVNEEAIQVELCCNNTQIYRVAGITSDTALTTLTPISPTLGAGSQYVLATLPEIPREHIRVVASLALAKMYSVAGDDQRVQEWTAIANANIVLMKDSLIERQTNNPPRKQRFQYGVAQKNRAFLR